MAAPKKPARKHAQISRPKTSPAVRKPAATAPAAAKPEPKAEAGPKSAWRQRWECFARKAMGTSLPEIMLIATLCMSRYLQNSDFSYPSEIILDIVLLSVFVTVFYYLYRLILRSKLASHVAALLLSYASYGFSYSFPTLRHWGEKLIPNSATPFTHAVLLLLWLGLVFGLTGLAVSQLMRRVKQLQTVPLLKFIIFVICFIFATELGKVGLRLWTIRHDLAYKQPATSLSAPNTALSATTAKPNVYYLLFDRYASDTTLKNDYNFDNSPMLDFLSSQGFVNRQDAYANYPFTMESVSSTLSMGYHTAIGQQFQNDAKPFQTAFPYRTILDNPPVAQAFKASGYQYNQVSSWWDFTRNIPTADSEPTESFRLRLAGKNFWATDLQRDIINKSILSPFLLKGITLKHTAIIHYQLDRNPTQNFYAQMHALKSIAASSKTQSQPQFTFAHVLMPHDPYIFDAQGHKPTYDGNRTDNGVDETVKYKNQLTYLNTQVKGLVSNLRQSDPSAVIVIQADEGPYPKQFRGTLTPKFYYDPINLPLQQMRQKFGVFASYYMPGADPQTVSTKIDSSVNTFRFVLNNYLGYQLPQLPDCQFTVGDKYNLYTYKLVTGQLKGTTNPASCKQYQ